MSLKRSQAGGRIQLGSGSDAGSKIDRQSLYDHLKRLAQTNQVFAPVDLALLVGAAEPNVSRALLGLSAEGFIEKIDAGKYRAGGLAEMPQAEFLKALSRATKIDSTRQRDLSDIDRLKKNNDIMRSKLLTAIAERDHYLAALKQRGIDPGPAPVPVASVPAPASPAEASAGSSGEGAVSDGQNGG